VLASRQVQIPRLAPLARDDSATREWGQSRLTLTPLTLTPLTLTPLTLTPLTLTPPTLGI